jgi:S-adenosylmethionine synthetase
MAYIFSNNTTESVTSGHPDKVCDQISDAILDTCLEQDQNSRVAVEAFGAHGRLIIGGEVTTNTGIDYASIARQVYRDIGYTDDLDIEVTVTEQSSDIAQGVDVGGAGDQGIMYGFATSETPEFLPKGVVLVHQLTKGLEKLRQHHVVNWLKPDGKAQITIVNNQLKTILVSAQHDETVKQIEIKNTLIKKLIKPLLKEQNYFICHPELVEGSHNTSNYMNNEISRQARNDKRNLEYKNFEVFGNLEILINPTGKFVQGGFAADTGLTGRKIMVDTYGGLVLHGGGCFSGKDPTKVDRSAAYMARFVAKSIVANGLARECLVSVAYAIGQAEPVMLEVYDEQGRSLTKLIKKKFDFRPQAIIERLDLRRPIYRQTASFGHFTDLNYPWEKIIDL